MDVFVSYRRTDVGGHAGRLADDLAQRLGPDTVFHDVTDIRPGTDFIASIDRALKSSDAVLAVIGPTWASTVGQDGRPRLHDPDDYVRLEVGRALGQGLHVVPVLVGGAVMPAAADLPADLQPLVRRQAAELHDDTWHRDVDDLVRSLRGEPDRPLAAPSRRRRFVGAALAAAVLVAGGTWWLWPDPDEPGGGTDAAAAERRTDRSALIPWALATATLTRKDGTLVTVKAPTVYIACNNQDLEFENGQRVSLELLRSVEFDAIYLANSSADGVVTLLDGRQLTDPIHTWNCPVVGTNELGTVQIDLEEFARVDFHR